MNIENDIAMIKEQFDDILSHSGDHGDFSLECGYDKFNEVIVTFKANINCIPYKEKEFVWDTELQTKKSFINDIKAWLFDVLDGVSNL